MEGVLSLRMLATTSARWRVAEVDLTSRSSAEIRAAFLAGERAAIEEVEGWVGGIVHGAWSFADPDAVRQEILLELVQLGRAGEVRSGTDFRAYVRSVARHSCIDAYRRGRLRNTETIDDTFFELPDDSWIDAETRFEVSRRRERLRFLWQALAPTCRDLLRWAYGDGLSAAAIAERLGIRAGNARVRLHRCLERARELRREFFP